MIEFRYHLVSIIAVFFALAVGIVLGAGPLASSVDENIGTQVSDLRQENQTLRDNVASAEAAGAYQEQFADALAPDLLEGQLSGRSVALVTLPGADDGVVDTVREQLETAGAETPLTVAISEAWTSSDSEPVLDGLAADFVAGGTELDADLDGYRRGAAVLAASMLGSDTALDRSVDTEALEAFGDAQLVSVDGSPEEAPGLVVVVAGDLGEGEPAQRAGGIYVGLLAELNGAASGSVLVGDPAAGDDDGLITAVIADSVTTGEVSTVDVANSAAGRVTTVLALAEQAAGGQGHYGVGPNVSAPVPAVPATTPTSEPGATPSPTEGAAGTADGTP